MPLINLDAVLNPLPELKDHILDYIPRATTSEFGIVALGSGINVDIFGRIYLDTQEYSDRLTAIETTAASTLETTVNTLEAKADELAASITQKLGIPNGIATLDSAGSIPSSQLPSYVDDVLEFLNAAAFPATGETGKIYVETTGSTTYRWSGTTYVKIASGEVSSVAGKKGIVTLTKDDVGLSNVDNTNDLSKPISTATQTALNVLEDKVKRGIANRYDSSLTYNSGERAALTNGDIVKSTIDGNVNDPNVDMTGWVKTNSASQIFDASGESQQEVNDLNLYVTKNERMFGVVGTGDETAKLSLALQEKNINLVSDQINTSARITTISKNIDGSGTKISSTGLIIPILTTNNDNFKLSNVEVDGNSGGQLNAGLIVVSATKDFLIEDVVLRNGGTVNGANPKGVNAIGVATDTYPTGGKSTGNLSRIFTYNFTKAPINWTTYAEEGTLSFSRFEQNVGNSYCPAIQVNGGKRFKSVFNFVKGTEGAGTTIGTVGTTPPLAAKEVLSFGNSYYDIGSLGVLNAERYAVHIAQNFGTTDTQDFVLSHEYLQNGDGMYRSTGGVSNTYLLGNISRNTAVCYSLSNAVGHYFRDQIALNYNKNNLLVGAWVMNNCSDIVIRGGKISSASSTSYLISSNSGTNTDIRVEDVKILDENIGILANTHYQYFRRTRIKISREFTVANNTTKLLHLSSLLSGRSVKVDLAISAVNGSNFVDGRVQALATSTDGTTCTILNNTVVKDAKSVGANSMVVDTVGANLRIQYTNNLGAEIKLLCEYDIYIY